METRDYICRYIPRIVLVSKKKKKKSTIFRLFSYSPVFTIFFFSSSLSLFKIKAKKRIYIRYNVEG